MEEELDFDSPTSMAQRVAIVASLMYAELLSESAHSEMEELANRIPGCRIGGGGKPGTPGTRAPTKGYARSFNKVYDDYLQNESRGGRVAWVVDALRCLIAGDDVETVKRIVRELSEMSNGLLSAKNPFMGTLEERSRRSHLLLINCIAVHNSTKTVGELVKGNAAEKIFNDFKKGRKSKGGTRKHSHREPTERWEMLCNKAVEILRNPKLRKVPAHIAFEVQITFNSFKEVRHDMHDAYDVTRATRDVQLYNQFA